MKFTGGGPVDGQELTAEQPPDEWFSTPDADGEYRLWDTAPVAAPFGQPSAYYEGVPSGIPETDGLATQLFRGGWPASAVVGRGRPPDSAATASHRE